MDNDCRIIEAAPISSLWNVVDNRVVSWCNRQVDWMCWYATTAAQLGGYATSSQWAVYNVTQKLISIALFSFSNYANINRVASTFHADEIKVLANKFYDSIATPLEKYRLADLLYRRALLYDCGQEQFISLPGHYKEEQDFFTSYSRLYLDSDTSSFVLLAAKYGTDEWCHNPQHAIKYDIQAARVLYKEVMDSEDPLVTESLKADAIYKFAFLFVHGTLHCHKEIPIVSEIPGVLRECKEKIDHLTDKGNYQTQMNRLSGVTDLTSLVNVSRHHPRKALECMESFGVDIQRFRDICKTCSKNIGIRDKFAQF